MAIAEWPAKGKGPENRLVVLAVQMQKLDDGWPKSAEEHVTLVLL